MTTGRADEGTTPTWDDLVAESRRLRSALYDAMDQVWREEEARLVGSHGKGDPGSSLPSAESSIAQIDQSLRRRSLLTTPLTPGRRPDWFLRVLSAVRRALRRMSAQPSLSRSGADTARDAAKRASDRAVELVRMPIESARALVGSRFDEAAISVTSRSGGYHNPQLGEGPEYSWALPASSDEGEWSPDDHEANPHAAHIASNYGEPNEGGDYTSESSEIRERAEAIGE
jgi:hypothetical protein